MKKLFLVIAALATALFANAQAPQYGRFHKALFGSAAPSTVCTDGTLYYASSNNKFYVCESATWVDLEGTLVSPTFQTSLVLDQTTGDYTFTWANPAANRAISIEDPLGTDVFVWKAATQTLTNKTYQAPTFTVNATGTFASRIAVNPTTDTLAALKIQDGGGSATGWFDTTADGVRTYGLYLNMFRPTTGVFVGSAGVDDAGVRVSVRNYAATHSNYILRGGNFNARNSTAATMGTLSGAIIGANNNAGTVPTILGAEINAENFGTNATVHGGVDVTIKNEAAKATTEFGVRVRNLNNSIGGPADAALLVSEPTLANTGWNYIIDANGVESPTKAFARLQTGALIYSGAQTTRAAVRAEVGDTSTVLGSVYISTAGKMYIKTAHGPADTDWERVTTSAAD